MSSSAKSPPRTDAPSDDFGSKVKELFKSIKAELIDKHNGEIHQFRTENAELRSRLEAKDADHTQSGVSHVIPSASTLESKPVLLSASDGESECTYWVHACVIDKIPHMKASRARWSAEQLEVQHLPPHCSHAALGVLLCRLYSPHPWPEQKWIEMGPQVTLETTLLADMWGLGHVVEEASAVLRYMPTTESTSMAIREILHGIAVPDCLKVFLDDNLPFLKMTDEEVCQMIVSCAANPNEHSQQAAEYVIECRQAHGHDTSGSLEKALRSADLVCVSNKRFVRTGQISYACLSVGHSQFQNAGGVEWLCTLVMKRAKATPACISEMIYALEGALENLKGRRRFDEQYTPDTPSCEAVDRHIEALLQIGADHANASSFSKDELCNLVLRHTKLVSGTVLAALTEDNQLQVIKRSSHDIQWFSCARLQALRGAAHDEAIRMLMLKLGSIPDDVCRWVRARMSL